MKNTFHDVFVVKYVYTYNRLHFVRCNAFSAQRRSTKNCKSDISGQEVIDTRRGSNGTTVVVKYFLDRIYLILKQSTVSFFNNIASWNGFLLK